MHGVFCIRLSDPTAHHDLGDNTQGCQDQNQCQVHTAVIGGTLGLQPLLHDRLARGFHYYHQQHCC